MLYPIELRAQHQSGDEMRRRSDVCSLNGNRTRISALRGLRPKPLDDKAANISDGRTMIEDWKEQPGAVSGHNKWAAPLPRFSTTPFFLRQSSICNGLLPRKDSNLDKQIQSLLSCH